MSAQTEKTINVLLTEDELDEVLDAIAKSKPVKVIDEFIGGRYGHCPTCHKLCNHDEKYCCDCGQHIYFEVERR